MRTLLICVAFLGCYGFVQAQPKQKPPLTVTRLTERVWVHVSYGEFNGRFFPSNGLIIRTNDGVVLIDTGWDSPENTDNTQQILRWVADSLRQPVRLCIVTHAHNDRVGGIAALHKAGVRVVSTPLTARKAVTAGYASPEGILPNDTTFTVGGEPIRCYFPGEGHTSDNIVVWLPARQILHGGCFIKSAVAFGMGNVADANLSEWANSVQNVINHFGIARIIVPGHEQWGGTESLQHTLNLLKKHAVPKR